MLIRLLILVSFAWVFSIEAPAASASGDGNCVTNPSNGQVICSATGPGTGGPPGPGGGSGGGCSYAGRSIPCEFDGAYWFPDHGCYASPGDNLAGPGGANAPPPRPGEQGQWWQCVAGPNPATPVQVFPWFVPTGTAPIPDPATLAKKALGEIQLATARVSTAPLAPQPEIVGVEVWLWVPRSQWATLSKTVRAGVTSVTATAVPNLVSWDMGDGSATFQCGGAGRPWESSYTDAAQTDCGYTYRTLSAGEPGGVFHITATISYFVTWTCTGACTSTNGNLGLIAAPAGTGSIQSLQRQTVVVTP